MLWFNFLEDYGCVLGYAEWIKYRFIEIPIITIKEVSHGTDNDTGFEEPQQQYRMSIATISATIDLWP